MTSTYTTTAARTSPTSSSSAASAAGTSQKNGRAKKNRALAKLSNAKRKGRIKEMETGLERTRQTVATLEASVKQLEKENRDLRRILGS